MDDRSVASLGESSLGLVAPFVSALRLDRVEVAAIDLDIGLIPGRQLEATIMLIEAARESLRKLTLTAESMIAAAGCSVEPRRVSESIFRNPNGLGRIADFLATFLPDSSLVTLRLRNLPWSPVQLKGIIKGIAASKIARLEMDCIPLGENGLALLLETLAPERFEEVMLKRCGLPANSGDAIAAFASRRSMRFMVCAGEVEERIVDDSARVAAAAEAVGRLKRDLEEARQRLRPVSIREGVAAVGNGAVEFAEFLAELARRGVP